MKLAVQTNTATRLLPVMEKAAETSGEDTVVEISKGGKEVPKGLRDSDFKVFKVLVNKVIILHLIPVLLVQIELEESVVLVSTTV